MNTTKKFEVTEAHLKLLRAMEVDWNGAEFGAPTINPKRPYGNSDVFTDMFEILEVVIKINGKKVEFDPDGDALPLTVKDELFDLHKDLEVVLEI